MSISTSVVNVWVLAAATPYAAIASYDFWLHETDRQVPRVERALHAVTITSVLLFLVSAALGNNLAASVVLVILLVSAAIDELRFHANLDSHERQVHLLGGVALAFCIGVWFWTI